ncbi:hypothetical protein [Adhaeribacter soli]|uniref:Uncharacterized protein n=1 Tax=Adhaeribacter soli TaxID=2607655 RepID=A0A5N1J0I1_9BACT|nr:hypothetical protein [Adhaeribacter soli]KAA9339994.1 hypothetical protein F0P94_06495 [Adhaeribacter soli]
MKKIFLIISLIVILILSLVFTFVHRDEQDMKEKIDGTYILSHNQLSPDSSNDFTVYITLSKNKEATYIIYQLQKLKNTKRTGNWNFKNDTLTITYQMEWLELLEKKEIEGGFTYAKNDSIVTKSEPFSIKYIVEERNTHNRRLCPVEKGQCFDRFKELGYE